jgi:hypothetical protein
MSSTPRKLNTIVVSTSSHFKQNLHIRHPLSPKGSNEYTKELADHAGRQQNHIWSREELHEKMATLYRHIPQKFSDHVMNKLMYGLYHTFNFVTGYNEDDPSVESIKWRLIVLESVAGVPGFVAAGFRHFKSLRSLERDHGWISTLLEEAENERMHLQITLQMADASIITRSMVIAAQCIMTPFLMVVYTVHPKSMHRFVGYLEETACHTYVNVINKLNTEGTLLYNGWHSTPAPLIGVSYYKLPNDARWSDVLSCMCADETHHRDVNHTFADMDADDPNPFVTLHKENAIKAWRLDSTGSNAFESDTLELKLERSLRKTDGQTNN